MGVAEACGGGGGTVGGCGRSMRGGGGTVGGCGRSMRWERGDSRWVWQKHAAGEGGQ